MLNRIDVKYFKLAVGASSIGKETTVDITARCPVCGDSRTHKNKKRLHLYIKNTVTNVNCFNGDCSVHNKTVYSFLKEFFPSLLPQYKRENFGTTLARIASGDAFSSESGDVFGDIKETCAQNTPSDPGTSGESDKSGESSEPEKKCEVLTHDLSPYLTPIESSPPALAYLHNRGYRYTEERYGKWYYGHQDLKIGDTIYRISGSIVIPLYHGKEMYGFYSRNIENKTFYTYMHDANIGYKIAFWFYINKNAECLVTEGIFDCLSINFDNKIALMGAKLPEERLKELKDPVFVLDNDKTGIINAIGYAKRGYKVFVQPQIYKEKDMNELKLNYPGLDIYDMIKKNTYQGISAVVRLQQRL